MNIKPLARWTIGPVSEIGLEILRESVIKFSRVYPEFDRVICHNNIDVGLINHLRSMADLHEQQASSLFYPLSPADSNPDQATGSGWKFCPPRLKPDSCELFLDNDIVILERLKSVDCWLADQTAGIVSEGLARKRMFGIYDKFIHQDVRACAGFFGLPPYFDFHATILRYCENLNGLPLGGYDEQGLTVASVVNMPKYYLTPLSELYIAEDHVPFPDTIPKAIHFVGSNRKNWHRGWKAYKRAKISLI